MTGIVEITDNNEEKINTLKADLENHLKFMESYLPYKNQIRKELVEKKINYAIEHCFDLTALGQNTKDYMIKINELKEAYELK